MKSVIIFSSVTFLLIFGGIAALSLQLSGRQAGAADLAPEDAAALRSQRCTRCTGGKVSPPNARCNGWRAGSRARTGSAANAAIEGMAAPGRRVVPRPRRTGLRVLRITFKGNKRVESDAIRSELITRVDDILSRLHEHGIESLSESDRSLLKRISARYRQRNSEQS